MSKEYYLNSDETLLLVRERGESRILTNWRVLESNYCHAALKLSKVRQMWEQNPALLGELVESNKLDEYLCNFNGEANSLVQTIASQLGGGPLAEANAREIMREMMFEED